MNITFSVDSTAAIKMFDNAVKAMADFSEPLKKTRTYELQQIDEAFKVSGKNITGTPWRPLSPYTIKEKLRSGFTTRILERTGDMRKSFKSIKMNKDELQITSVGIPYFEQHQKGSPGYTLSGGIKIPEIPQRQMLGFSKEMVTKIEKIFTDYISNKIKNG